MARLPRGMSEYKGRIRYQFTEAGKRYSVYGQTVKECREKELEKRKEIEQGLNSRGKNQTMNDFYDKWVDNRRGTVKGNTLRTNNSLWGMIKGVDVGGTKFGMLKMLEVTPDDIRALQKGLTESHSTRTANDCIALVRSMFKSAVNDRMTTWNPCNGIKRLKQMEEPARDTIHRALSKEETARFLKEAKDSNSYYLPLYNFLLQTGCRIGEAGAITSRDIQDGVLFVQRTITRDELCAYEIGTDAKTNAGRRNIPLTQGALEAIKTQKLYNAALQGKVRNINGLIFVAPRGGMIKSENVGRDMAAICERIGIEKITPHSFRATFATRCIESGMQVKTLQEVLGHTDVKMTLQLYAHCMIEDKTAQVMAVNF